MTLLDDGVLVRELLSRADRALPPMALDATEVLAGGRRRRRRTRRCAVGAVAGTLAGVVVALGVGPLGGSATAPAATSEVLRGDGFTITVPTAVVALDTSVGTVLDLGVPVDAARPDGSRYVVLEAADGLELRRMAPDGRVDADPELTTDWGSGGLSSGPVGAGSGDTERAVLLVAMSDPTMASAVTLDGKVLTVLTAFAAPDGSPFLTFALLQTDGRPAAELPTIAVGRLDLVHDLLAGGAEGQYVVDAAGETAQLQFGDLTVTAKLTARTVGADAGVPIETGMAPATPGSADVPMPTLVTAGDALNLVTVGYDGSTGLLVHAEEAKPSGTSGGGAVWDGQSVWALESVPDGTTVTLVVDGKPGGDLPTFAVGGLAGRFVLVRLQGGVADTTGWPDMVLEFHRPGGITDSTELPTGTRS